MRITRRLASIASIASFVCACALSACATPPADGDDDDGEEGEGEGGEGEGEGDPSCNLECGSHARCDASAGSPECVCLAGYEGDGCATCSYGYRAGDGGESGECVLCIDGDADGVMAIECGGRDCQDDDARVPDRFSEGSIGEDTCFDGYDNDCNGAVDNDDATCTPPCNDDGWCMVRERFSGGLFEGSFMFAPDDAWVAGESYIGTMGEFGGVIHHWNGERFDLYEFPELSRIQTVYGLAPDDVWASGSGTIMLRWDGTTWSDVSAQMPGNRSPYIMWGSAVDDIWGVTFGFGIVHWDGNAWTEVRAADTDFSDGLGFAPEPSSMTGCAPNDIWLADGRSLYRFDGARLLEWTNGSDALLGTLRPTFASGAGELFVAGGAVFRHNGAALEREIAVDASEADPLAVIRTVAATTSEAWAAGDGGALFKWDGTTSTWSAVPDTGTGAGNDWIFSAAFEDGQVLLGARNGSLDLYDEATGTFDNLVFGSFINAFDQMVLLSTTEGFAVDDDEIYELSGGSWSQMERFDSQIQDIVAFSATDAWAVGNDSLVYRYDGANWQQVFTGVLPNQAGETYAAVGGTSSSDVWIAGTATVLHYNGSTFSIVDTGDQTFGFAPRIFARGIDDVFLWWGTALLHHDGTSFSTVGPALYAYELTCDAPDRLRIVGSGLVSEGTALGRFDGTRFTVDAEDTSVRMHTAAFVPDGVFTAGALQDGQPRFAFSDGTSWVVQPPPGESFHSVLTMSMLPSGDGIAAGTDGAIYVRVAP